MLAAATEFPQFGSAQLAVQRIKSQLIRILHATWGTATRKRPPAVNSIASITPGVERLRSAIKRITLDLERPRRHA
ncbi:MAG: hypothetical protein L0211_21780 [Planctomycetaceae bacterium]|nr:hypothetical protein [Planctomycetaceae bacterium]